MSCFTPVDCERHTSAVSEIEALVAARGGRIMERGSQVALALLGGRLTLLLMKGPGAGTQAILSHAGICHVHNIQDPHFLEVAQGNVIDLRDKNDMGEVYDLPGGEACLREVMEKILRSISPQISALMSNEASDQKLGHGTRGNMPEPHHRVWRNKAECLDALAPLLKLGGVGYFGPEWAAVVDFLTKDLSEELRRLVSVNDSRSLAHLVLGTPGLGKTRSIQTLIEALPMQAIVWVFQPTLRKADEFARDMSGSARNIRVFRGRGAPEAEGSADTMCKRHNLAAKIAAKGFSVKRVLCGSLNEAGSRTCQHIATCGYQAQIRVLESWQGGGVFVMTHASLSLPPPVPEPHLIIIDEDPSASLPRSFEVDARALSEKSDWAGLLEEVECEDGSCLSGFRKSNDTALEGLAHEEPPVLVLHTLDRLLQGLRAAAPLHEIAATIDISELESALKVLQRLERKLRANIRSSHDDQDLEAVLADSPLPVLQSVQAVLTAIYKEVRLFVAGVIDRPDFNGLRISCGDDGQVSSLKAYCLAQTAIKPSVPMIVLDGTADSVLIGRALRRRMKVWRIQVSRQGEVVQCLGRSFSNASLVHATGYPSALSSIEEREQLWQGVLTVLRREVDTAPQGVLVVSTLAVEIEARRRQECEALIGERLDWTHFGATRGINSFSNRQTIVLIGRKQPPAMAVQDLARSYFAFDADPIASGVCDYIVRHRTLFDKMGHASAAKVQVHPDPRVNRILWQMREAEVIQSIDRVRAVRFPRRILILNTLDLRRPDEDRCNQKVGVPADIYLSWSELCKGGNRAEIVLFESDGFLPVAPKVLAKIAPENFCSVVAAKKWLHRTDLKRALARSFEHLVQLQVRPEGQRGASWPLLVDRRQHPCLTAARDAWEAKLGTRMAVWMRAELNG